MKIKRVGMWFVTNSIFMAVLVLGTFYEINGAKNVAVFMCWLMFFATLFLFTENAEKRIKKHGRSVPVWINFPFDLSVLVILLWFDFWLTSIAWALHIICQEAAFYAAPKQEEVVGK